MLDIYETSVNNTFMFLDVKQSFFKNTSKECRIHCLIT